jgi:hypothetical protein
VTNLIIFAHVSIFLLGWYRIVESVGEGVTDLKPGDHVLPVFTGECKECRQCKSEESNMCDLLRINTDRGVMLNDGKSRFSIRGQPTLWFMLAVLPRSIQLLHLTKYVSSAVEFLQVGLKQQFNCSYMNKEFVTFF